MQLSNEIIIYQVSININATFKQGSRSVRDINININAIFKQESVVYTRYQSTKNATFKQERRIYTISYIININAASNERSSYIRDINQQKHIQGNTNRSSCVGYKSHIQTVEHSRKGLRGAEAPFPLPDEQQMRLFLSFILYNSLKYILRY